jgi:hypothetical protein
MRDGNNSLGKGHLKEMPELGAVTRELGTRETHLSGSDGDDLCLFRAPEEQMGIG